MQDKKINLFTFVFIALFVLIMVTALFSNNIRTFTRASQATVSIEKSVIITSLLQTTTSNPAGIAITVFVRNDKGLTLENKKVDIQTTLGQFDKVTAISDKYGKASFILVSTIPGDAKITATVDNLPLTQPLTIKFVN